MEGLIELDGPVCVIGDVDVLGPTNVDVPGATVSVPSGEVVDANTGNVEVDAEDEEQPLLVPRPRLSLMGILPT